MAPMGSESRCRYAKILRVVIVDKDEAFCKKVRAELQRYLKESCSQMEITVKTNGRELLGIEESMDIYFISLDVPELKNLELAKMLRKKNVDSEIVFMSIGEEPVRLSLCVKPMAYVRKGELGKDLEEAIHTFWEIWYMKHKKVIILDSKKPCLIEPGEIKFCQSEEHYVKLYRKSNDYIMIRNTLKEVEKDLAYYSFTRVNVRNLVNMNYIASIKGNKVALGDGSIFSISQTYRNVANDLIWKHFNKYSYKK